MPKLKPVLITWTDPMSHVAWSNPDEVKAFVLPDMFSLGWLLESSKKYVKVVLTKSQSEDRIADILMLPRRCVKKIQAVKLPCK